MNSTTIFEKYTDIISDKQTLQCWGFDINTLKENGISDYTRNVRDAILYSLQNITESKNKRIRDRAFTVFIGDYGNDFEFFAAGIKITIDKRIKQIITTNFQSVQGYYESFGEATPYISLTPEYRYTYGKIFQYTFEDSKIGKKVIENIYGKCVTLFHREWISAEEYDTKEAYIK
jgi:hypothetical protein